MNPASHHWFSAALTLYEQGVILYLFVQSTIYFVLLLVGFSEMIRHRFTQSDSEDNRILETSTLVPPVCILAPAFNEAATIRESIRSDDTLQLLIEEFHLYRSARFYEGTLPAKPVRAVYESINPIPLVVVDKENGGKADALNAGINVARYPLVCAVDSDSLLEPDALLRVARPFLEDPKLVLAVGGIVRVANGCATAGGRVLKADLPQSWIARCQVVEYFRSFLGGRIAFSVFNSLFIISGAFGLFSKRALLAVGGYCTSTVGVSACTAGHGARSGIIGLFFSRIRSAGPKFRNR